MRDLYIILSAIGWAWCLLAAAFLLVLTRKDARPRGPGGTEEVPGGTEEVRA